MIVEHCLSLQVESHHLVKSPQTPFEKRRLFQKTKQNNQTTEKQPAGD